MGVTLGDAVKVVEGFIGLIGVSGEDKELGGV